MRRRSRRTPLLLALALACQAMLPLARPAAARAELINVELRFSPYQDAPAEGLARPSVEGRALVSLNGIPVMNEVITERTLLLDRDSREPTPLVWIPMGQNDPLLRRRDNLLRLTFIPRNAGQPYATWLSWNGVSDREQRSESILADGTVRVTTGNLVDLQVTERRLSGELVYERRFDAPWVKEESWQALPAITGLSAADEAALRRLVRQRRDLYGSDLREAYAVIPARAGVDVAVLRQNRCLELARDGGMVFGDADGSGVRLRTTGGPVVVAEGSSGDLFPRQFPEGFGRRHDAGQDLCLLGALAAAFPRWLLFVRNGDGSWRTLN